MAEEQNAQNRSLELCRRKVTTESFIAEAKEIYGDCYDYSKVNYVNSEHRVVVTCPIHGDFEVYAREHLDGKGCPQCAKGEKFIKKLQEKFGNKFGLEKFIYTNSSTPITLICPKHGEFSKLPNAILSSKFGCPECANEYQKSLQEEAHNAAEAKKEEKRKAREEAEKKRLNDLMETDEYKYNKDLTFILEAVMEQVGKGDVLLSSFPEWNKKLLKHIKTKYGHWASCYDREDRFALGKTFNAFYRFWYYDNENPPFHCYGTRDGDVLFTKNAHKWIESERRYDFEKGNMLISYFSTDGSMQESSKSGCAGVLLLLIIAAAGLCFL
ncbi:MAG: DUF723 domain-containing protein [Muribaculaceae bacterium]|nr:DUF723 domain-containing protein [Muribaculaceae bacterium]